MAQDFIDVRLTLARFLAIALEFQLGADILSTAVTPSWDAIGKLAAIAVIRTTLNYFLSRDMPGGAEWSSPTLGSQISPHRFDIGQPGGTNIVLGIKPVSHVPRSAC